MVFKISGYKLFRDSWQQSNQGKYYATIGEAKPGDLVFFKNEEEQINHVAILLEADRVIHASGRVRVDHVDNKGILNGDSKTYSHTFSHVRRIIAM